MISFIYSTNNTRSVLEAEPCSGAGETEWVRIQEKFHSSNKYASIIQCPTCPVAFYFNVCEIYVTGAHYQILGKHEWFCTASPSLQRLVCHCPLPFTFPFAQAASELVPGALSKHLLNKVTHEIQTNEALLSAKWKGFCSFQLSVS